MSLVHLPQVPEIVLRISDQLGPAARHPGVRVAQSLPPADLLPTRGDARATCDAVRQAADAFESGRREVRRRHDERQAIAERDLAARADAAASGAKRPQPGLPAHDAALVELAEEVAVLSGVLDRKVAVWEAVLRDERHAIQKHVHRRVHAARETAAKALDTAAQAVEQAEVADRGAQVLGLGVRADHLGFARELRERARAAGLGAGEGGAA